MISSQQCIASPTHPANANPEFSCLCIHDLFSRQAVLHPECEAVVYGNERLTYRDLDSRSNQLAGFLLGQGIQPEEHIGIFMNRSVDLIVAIVGILKAGATYVPIDIEYPAERVRFIVEDAHLTLVLTQLDIISLFKAEVPCIPIDNANLRIGHYDYEGVTSRCTPESIAVLSYTSGSTGQPKAACIPHRAIVRAVWKTNYLHVTAEDRIAQAGSPAFDAAILEIWLALANGAALVGLRKEFLLNLTELPKALRREKISILLLNTAYVHQIGRDAPNALNGIRKLLFGGEVAEAEPLRALLRTLGPDVLINTYGPAEGCVITSYHEIRDIPSGAATIPIGIPVTNTQIYLLDELLKPVSAGTPGEIVIGGEGVGCGYFNKPDLTTQRFLPDHFSGKLNRLLYRTGDLARICPNGELEFIGRTDEQVKIRGHRIELSEVRYAVSSHPLIKQVFLMVREDVPGDKRLVAYVVLKASHANPAIQDLLKQHTLSKLPAEMVPAAFIIVDSIPLNINGKVDRHALPRPSQRPQSADTYRTPQGDLEHKLALIWRDLLGVDRVGVHDNFFDLGGHSLLAARLISQIERQMGINIPLATLFESPTIAQLAQHLNGQTYESAWHPLIELFVPEQPSTATPFFCVHSLGANLVSIHKLAKLMAGERPVYGLQPHGLDGVQKPFESIETIATAYVEEIRQKQPHGPYLLGGICLGGVIAYEIGQQLRASGEQVSLVVLIDSYAPGKHQHLCSRSKLTQYLDWHLGEVLMLRRSARLHHLAHWFTNGLVRVGRVLGIQDHSSIANATRTVSKAHRNAFLAYRPKPYQGKVVQMICGEASHRSYEDRRLAWSSLAPAGFEVRLVPGNHHTMIEEPHARVLAQELRKCLDRAQVSERSAAVPEPGRQDSTKKHHRRLYTKHGLTPWQDDLTTTKSA